MNSACQGFATLPRQEETGDSSGGGEKNAFRKQLPDQAAAASPQRPAHGNFSLPRYGPREHQIREVCAGN
jgi:hypothetical protein